MGYNSKYSGSQIDARLGRVDELAVELETAKKDLVDEFNAAKNNLQQQATTNKNELQQFVGDYKTDTDSKLTELESEVGSGIILKQGDYAVRLVASVNSGFFVETNDDFGVYNVTNVSIDGVREIIASDDRERSSYFINANGKYEITFCRKDNKALTPNDDVIKSFVSGAILSSENTITDIINVNKIIGSEESFTSIALARQSVPTQLRKPNATLYYNFNGKVRIEKYPGVTYDATTWVYGTWEILSYANSMNISLENGVFESKDAARKYNIVRSAGTFITYLLDDGWHTELLLEDTRSSMDKYWKEVAFVPYVDSKIANHNVLYVPKGFGAMSKINLLEEELKYGYIDAYGEYQSHSRRVVTEPIYVGGNNAINIVYTGAWGGKSINTNVFVYKLKEDGSFVFSRKTQAEYLTPTQHQVAFLQHDETHIRFYCEFTDESWASVKPTFSQFLESVNVYCGRVSNEISNAGYIEVDKYIDIKNDNVGWALGQFGFVNNKKNYTTIKPIRVKEGVKYMLNAKSMSNISDVLFLTSSDGIEWVSGGWQKYNSGSPRYNVSFRIPKGHELCRIVVNFYTESDKLYDLDKYEVRLWDTSLNKECFADKIIPLVKESTDKGLRYAQGIAIDNGYIFQAFATGEIDVYRLSDRKFIQTFAMPNQGNIYRHMGVLAFLNSKYQKEDDFNLMILPADYSGYKDLLVRWIMADGSLSYEVVGELPLIQGKNEYSRFGYDTKHNKLIVQYYNTFETIGDYASTEGYPTCEIYSVSEWNENAVYSLDKSFDLVDGYAYQSAFVNGDKIYEPVGVGLNAVSIFVINSFTEKVERIIDMTQFGLDIEEPQGMTMYDGKVFLATVYGIYIINL